jgi:hypothetical protein
MASKQVQGYIDDFGQEAVNRAAATAKMDRETKPSLRRVKKQAAPLIGPKVKPDAAAPVVGKPTLMTAAPRVDTTPPPAPEPTYGGRPASELESASKSRIDEFHVSDQQLAAQSVKIPKNPADPAKDATLAAYESSKKRNVKEYGQETEPLPIVKQRLDSTNQPKLNGKPILGPKTEEEASRKPFSSSDLQLALATAEADKASKIKTGAKLKRAGKGGLTVDDKQIASVRGQLAEATDRETTAASRVDAIKTRAEAGQKNPKTAQNPGMPSYVWDSKADKFGTRGKRGKITHVSDEQDDLIRAELTRKADQPKLGKGEVGRDGNKFEPSTTDWQGQTPTRAEIEEGAKGRAQRGPRTSAGEVTGDRVTNEGGPRAGKRFRQAQSQQDQYDRFTNTEEGYVDKDTPEVLEKQAQLLGKDVNDPDYKAPGSMTEHRARARIVVHGGVKEDVAMNIKGQALLDLHDTIMDKKRFEESRVGSGNEDVFSHASGHIKPGDLMETGNKLNGVNEERPVPIGQTFKRSKSELGKGAGELVTSSAPGSDYTAGEIRPLSGFEGHTRERRMNPDGSFRHVWVENKLPADIQHASDRIVESVNKFGGFKPKQVDRQRRKTRAEADKQNAIAGETEEYGVDKRTRNRAAGGGTGANVEISAKNQAEMRARGAWAAGEVEDAATIEQAQPTTSDSILSRAAHAKKTKKIVKAMASANVHLGQPPKATSGKVREEKLETVPGATPQPDDGERFSAAVAAAPAPSRKSQQFTGATIPRTGRSTRVSLRTVETPVEEGGLGKATSGVNVTAAQEIQEGPVDRSRGDSNPFARRVGDFDTAVVQTRGRPILSQQMQRAALASTPVAAPTEPAAPRKLVAPERKLTPKEQSAVDATTADDSKALVTRGGGGRGKAPIKLYAAGTRVTHKDHGPGEVYGQDSKNGKLAIRFDKDPDTVMDDISHKHVTSDGSAEVKVPTRGKRANQPIKETAEPSEGPLDLKDNGTTPLDKRFGK